MSQDQPMRVGAYIRTSSDEQEASEQEQLEYIQDFCRKKGWEVGWIRNDEISGYEDLDRRPGLKKLLEDQDRFDFLKIVVWKSERAFRNTEVALRIRRILRERGCIIVGTADPVQDDGSAEAKLVIGMTAVTAEHYRNNLSDRQKASHKFKVSKGIHQGGPPPFGYRSVPDKHQVGHAKFAGLEPDPEVFGSRSISAWVPWIFEEFLRHPNVTQLALTLNQHGVPSPAYLSRWHRIDEAERAYRVEKAQRRAATGQKVKEYPPAREWDSSVISSVILRNRTYLGEVAYHAGQGKNNTGSRRREKTWHPGAHEPLVSHQLFNQVQVMLDTRSQSNRKPADKANDVLLGGMITCGSCGKAVTRIAKNQWQQKYLCNRSRTSRGTVCEEPRYNSNTVDDAATKLLMRGIKLRRQQILAGGQHRPVKGLDAMAAEVASLEAEKERLKLMFRKGHIDEIELDRDMAELLPKIEAAKAKLVDDTGPGSLEELSRVVENIERHWATWGLEQKQRVLRTYVPKGFKLAKGVLQATVCGLTIEVDLPILPPPTKGMKYGSAKKQSAKSDSKRVTDPEGRYSDGGGVSKTRNPAAPTPRKRIDKTASRASNCWPSFFFGKTAEETMATKDCNGNVLNDGDSVHLTKDLKVKGANATLKRGTLIKNIRLTDNELEIECNAEKIKGLVLKTEFLKKA